MAVSSWRTDFRHNWDYNALLHQLEIRAMAAKRNATRREWTKQDLRDLKSLARERTPARSIGRKLRRSEGAVRQKAYAVGISLSLRGRTSKKRGK
jgi:hypothetical protein